MLDANGKYVQLTLDQARTIILEKATAAGVEVIAGSVEDQIKEWLAQVYVEWDTAQYTSVVKQFTPTGSDIDLQNPGFPRLQATTAKGFLKIDNTAGGSVAAFPEDSTLTAPNGNTYTNPTALAVAAGAIGFLSIQSASAGAAQNLPAGQTFTGGPAGAVITNPQPITGGMDTESDSAYLNRLTYYKSNNTSQQTTVAAKKELLQYYQDAALYVNSTNNGMVVPVPIPPQGLNIAIILESGINAGLEEIQNAINVITNRFEFGNLNNQNSDLHPILQGSSYSGAFPQAYSITVAQAVITTVECTIGVSFPPETLNEEKAQFAEAFATQFVQRVINLLTGAAGNYNFTFDPLVGANTTTTPAVVASTEKPQIGPFITIEAIRSLISDLSPSGSQSILRLESCDNLSVEFDPNEYEQTPILLSIFAPYEGTLSKVDFVLDSLFSDGSSWFDRYVFLDPSRIHVVVVEN